MTRRQWMIILGGFLFIVLAVSAGSLVSFLDLPKQGVTQTQEQHIAGMEIHLRAEPAELSVGKTIRLQFSITREGQAVTGLKPEVDLTMPEMAMDVYRVLAKEQTPGLYEAEVLLSMPGTWKVLFLFTTSDGQNHTASFELQATLPA